MRCNLFLITLLLFTCFGLRVNGQGTLPLEMVADVPLPGGAFRFDYQSLDSEGGRLYMAHLGANQPSDRRFENKACLEGLSIGIDTRQPKRTLVERNEN